MTVKKLQWDSDFFEIQVGEANIQEEGVFTVDLPYELLYTKQESEGVIEIQGYQKTFEETKIVYTKKITEGCRPASHRIIDYDTVPIENHLMYDLAYISGGHSRFFLDKKFGREKFQNLYRLWVDNSINKKFAEKIFYIVENGEPAGLVTLQNKDGNAYIGLIAVSPNVQNQGIGRQLLLQCENYCLQKKYPTLNIPTQKENTQACIFYEKNGYAVSKKTIIKHFWKT